MAKLEGKVAIITGASRGIGAAIPFGIASLHAHRLAKDGATVVINYGRSAEQAKELVSAIEANGGKALAVQADMSQVTDLPVCSTNAPLKNNKRLPPVHPLIALVEQKILPM